MVCGIKVHPRQLRLRRLVRLLWEMGKFCSAQKSGCFFSSSFEIFSTTQFQEIHKNTKYINTKYINTKIQSTFEQLSWNSSTQTPFEKRAVFFLRKYFVFFSENFIFSWGLYLAFFLRILFCKILLHSTNSIFSVCNRIFPETNVYPHFLQGPNLIQTWGLKQKDVHDFGEAIGYKKCIF